MELTREQAYVYVVGGAIAAVAIVGLLFLWLLRRREPVPWRVLAGYYPGSKWYSEVDTDPRRIVKALQAAEQCLIERTNWTAANMALVGHYVRVRVRRAEAWQQLWGDALPVHVAMTVGPSLAGLCHELAHLAEVVIDAQRKDDHEGWAALGVERALEDYDQWLTRLVQTENVASGAIPISRGHWLTGMQACRYRRPA